MTITVTAFWSELIGTGTSQISPTVKKRAPFIHSITWSAVRRSILELQRGGARPCGLAMTATGLGELTPTTADDKRER
jgi:hypothetical protein